MHPDPVPDTSVIPLGVQPRLQLSLDVLMIENYNGLVSQHAGGGSWATGPLGDGTLRHGAERAIITNIHGLWSQGQGSINDFRNYPAAPEQSRSMMWLGVITAMMFNSLTFQGSFGWGAPTTPGGGWLQEIQQEIWTSQVEQLMPSFTAAFGTVHPEASVASAKCLRPSAHAVVNECADPIRVRAWRELCNETSELCVHVIVVNIALDSPVQFQLNIEGLGLTAATNATRLFDAAYNTTVSQQGTVADYAAPGESLIYEIGCHEAAPKQLSTPTFPDVNDGRPSGTAGLSPWERCMNRRVLCKDGFVEKSPFNATCQPPGNPAAAVHTTLKTDDGLMATSARGKTGNLFRSPPPLPPTWGFNYDHTYPAGTGGCQQILADLLVLPSAAAGALDAKLRADFSAMRRMNGTAVRLYVSLDSLVTGPREVNQTAMAALQHMVDLAAESRLTVDLTAGVMRQPGGPHPFPSWLAAATDVELRAAQRTFWTGCARQFHGQPAILGFNLLNEPVGPATKTTDFAIGCLSSTKNGSAFGPQCREVSLSFSLPTTSHCCARTDSRRCWQGVCYSNHMQRSPYNVSFVHEWCSEMAGTIHDVDPTRRVTLGDLVASTFLDAPLTCTKADGLDYYSLHLYPFGNATMDELAESWRKRIASLPDDGNAVMIEEVLPANLLAEAFPGEPVPGGCPQVNVSCVDQWPALLRTYITSTSPRAKGWMSFYWGSAEQMRMAPGLGSRYETWLGIFAAGRPWGTETATIKTDDTDALSTTAGPSDLSPPLVVSGQQCGRMYEGIGGLLNSNGPWLKAYPPQQREEILDILFRPSYAASLQVLKLEIGGDGHSTINTESSHMHTEGEEPSFRRGWVLWFMQQAKRRNPALRIGGLAWAWPAWTKGSVAKKVRYLTAWAVGLRQHYNVSVDFMGLQNEGLITGGPANFSVALRRSLDAAGFAATLIECCDAHDFKMLDDPAMRNHSSDYFRAVDALAVHEPLRDALSVPAAALATGKRIWSSESWQSFANSEGGGCWARGISWGWVLGNLTRHMAWNLIQTYPSVGNGIVYNGHGLMWAEVPWAGHYWINSPIWVSAHYTQGTAPGWAFLPVGSGSGMLPGGGSYVSLVPPHACGATASNAGMRGAGASAGDEPRAELTIVVQTMTHDLSQCYRDSHPPFSVVPQNATFKIAAELLSKLLLQRPANASGGSLTMFVRRTKLFQGNVDDPYFFVSQRANRYFESLPPLQVSGSSGEFSVLLGIDEVWTISTVATMSRGNRSPGNDGLPVPPNSTAWPAHVCAALTGHPIDTPLIDAVVAIDQQGVWESAVSRDPRMRGGTTMHQVVPAEPDEWHGSASLKWPQTFVGPAANLSAGPTTISCSVLPPAFPGGWVGIGIGGQTACGDKLHPGNSTLAVWANGSWSFNGRSGHNDIVRPALVPPQNHWSNLSVTLSEDAATGQRVFSASIDGAVVAAGVPVVPSADSAHSYANPYLAAAYSTASGNSPGPDSSTPERAETRRGHLTSQQSNAEFRDLCLSMQAELPKRASTHSPSPPHPPPPPPSPPPPPGPPGPPPGPAGPGLGLAPCDAGKPAQLWAFSGKDGGLAGTVKPSANGSMCLDAAVKHYSPILLQHCVDGAPSQLWRHDSSSGQLRSIETFTPIHGSAAQNVSRCLDTLQGHVGVVDLWDCKKQDANQVWEYKESDPTEALFRATKQGQCLVWTA